MCAIKILALNIWSYNNFKERQPKIIRLIKKQNPDIVAFTSAGDFEEFNKKGDNQAKQLNKALNYLYYAYYPVEDLHDFDPKMFKRRMVADGTAILSRYPILKIERHKLQKQRNDKHHRGILYAKIKADKIFHIIIVHFSNDDVFSLLHLQETLDYVKRKGISPIMAGDFNIKHTEYLHKLTDGDYKSSFAYKKYFSYPSKKETLDYILIPTKFEFENVEIPKSNVSDHRAVVASITI